MPIPHKPLGHKVDKEKEKGKAKEKEKNHLTLQLEIATNGCAKVSAPAATPALSSMTKTKLERGGANRKVAKDAKEAEVTATKVNNKKEAKLRALTGNRSAALRRPEKETKSHVVNF